MYRLLQLELTEDVFVEGREPVLETLHALKAKGLAIAVGDFGTAHSSLHNRGFEPNGRRGYSAGSGSWPDAGYAGCGRGVEVEWQLQRLLMLSCERAQGYLLGRPMISGQLSPVRRQIASHRRSAGESMMAKWLRLEST